MTIVYIADDGTHFDNEWECRDYEWKLKHPHLKDVHIFDENDKEFFDLFSDDTYHGAQRVVITTQEAILDFIEFARDTGFCAYDDIIRVGEWVFNEVSGFELVEE